ncbi:MAG TPA: acetyl-CoA acetyltransferase [Steroidobacteraceae bacterium]|jgi:acetyl-CoA acetyltransferase
MERVNAGVRAVSLRAQHIPVLVGIGEVTDRPTEPRDSMEPLALMAEALRRADEDAGGGWLSGLNSLDVVGQVTWRYDNLPVLLARRIGASPQHLVNGPVGGESPIRLLHEAALRISHGETEVAAIVGGEAMYARAKAKEAGLVLPWTPMSVKDNRYDGMIALHPLAQRLGTSVPAHIYPFYEIASQAQWGQTPEQAREESGALWSAFSRVAADNPYAWSTQARDAASIVTPSATNRLIAWPYTKSMVANPNVNQGAAVLICSLDRARREGIAEDRLIYFHAGAAASEPEDYLQRDAYYRSTAQDAVLQGVLREMGKEAAAITHLELYSCFPCVPKMALRSLGLRADTPATVTGGLSFFGGPLNNYMSHAVCAMTRRLRADGGGIGLLYGQGGFVNKHHALILGARPSERPLAAQYGVQQHADRARGPVPPIIREYNGPATLETFTILYDRAGVPAHGVAIARVPAGQRLIARVAAQDGDTLNRLTDPNRSAVGLEGRASTLPDSLLQWEVQ